MIEFYIRYAIEETRVYPVYGDGFSVRYSEVDGEVFKRQQVQGELIFKGEDYAYIMNRDDTQLFTLRMIDENEDQLEMHFTRRDGVVNYDEYSFTVTPSVRDAYTAIMAVMDREINWLEFAPAMQTLLVRVAPIIQIYEIGSDRITCYGLGGYWTQTVENLVSNPSHLQTNHGFGAVMEFLYARTNSWQMDSRVFDAITRETLDGAYYIHEAQQENEAYDPQDPYDSPVEYRWEIRLKTNDLVIWAEPWWRHPSVFREPYDTVYDVVEPGYQPIEIRRRRYAMRMVVAQNTFGNWRAIADGDIMPRSIYRFAMAIDPDQIYISDAWEDEENRYNGIRPDFAFFPKTPDMHPFPGAEYLAPTWLQDNVVPLDPQGWDGMSFWFVPTSATDSMLSLDLYASDHVIKDAYTLGGVIQAMLTATGVGVSFTEVSDSEFFATLPVMVTPKGNVVVWNYTAPTTISNITLGRLFEVIKKVFRVYWHVKDGSLKMEHIKYYLNGGSYDETPEIALDLTENMDVQYVKPLSYFQNSVSYETPDVPYLITHEFEDPCGHMFKGFGLGNRSFTSTLDTNQTEQIKIELVSTDLQHALVNPGRYAKEGLFFFEYETSGNQARVPYTTFFLRGMTDPDAELANVVMYTLLNGRMSMAYLLDRYHADDMITTAKVVNTILRWSDTVKPTISQTIELPYRINADWMKAFKTEIGTGLIREMTVNVATKNASAQLKLASIETGES